MVFGFNVGNKLLVYLFRFNVTVITLSADFQMCIYLDLMSQWLTLQAIFEFYNINELYCYYNVSTFKMWYIGEENCGFKFDKH